jgi:hypothetical protein
MTQATPTQAHGLGLSLPASIVTALGIFGALGAFWYLLLLGGYLPRMLLIPLALVVLLPTWAAIATIVVITAIAFFSLVSWLHAPEPSF